MEASMPDPAIAAGISDIGREAPQIVKDVEAGRYNDAVPAVENLWDEEQGLYPTIMKETKAGYKTTEFWLVIVSNVLSQSGAISLPGHWGKAVFAVATVVGYVLSRGVAKHGVANEEYAP